MKRSWTEWREKGEESQEESNREAETLWSGDFLGELGQLWLKCASIPCVCLEGMIDKRIELLRLEREITMPRDKAQKAAEKVTENERIRLLARGEGSDSGLEDPAQTKGSQARGEGHCPGLLGV